MTGGEVVFKFTGDSSNLDKSISGIEKKVSSSTGNITKSIVTALGIDKLVSKSFDMIGSSVDGAISRLDTMNNFPKVMSNLGIASDDAEKSIKKMSDKLTGLPTTIDSASLAVQRFTSKNGDINKSTNYFLALNNAILAGGASTETQASAIEQMMQAYSKGKPDLMEWRSLLTAMPAQLKQVATSMGYVSETDLYDALKEGSISMDDFLNEIVKLNKEGAPGFASFEEQARGATGGINTSMKNMKTAITRGVANVISSLDKGLKSAGLGGLSQVISNIGKSFEKTLGKIASKMPSVISFIVKFGQELQKWAPLLVVIGTAVGTFVGVLKLLEIVNTIKNAFMLFHAVLLANPFVLIVAAIAGLVAGFIYLWNNCEAFKNFFVGIWETIKNAVTTAIQFITGIFTGIIDFISNNWQMILGFLVNPFGTAFALLYEKCEGFRNFIDGIVEGVKSILNKIVTFVTVTLPNKISSGISAVVNFFTSLPSRIASGISNVISKVKNMASNVYNAFTGIPGKLKSVGGNLVSGLWNGINDKVSWITDKIKGFGDKVLKSIKKIFGIGSPSKITFQYGNWMDEGLINGVNDMKQDVSDSFNGMFDLSPSMINNASTNLSPYVDVTVNNQMGFDPLGQVVNDIKTFSGGSKNDYNYGGFGG